MNDGVEPAEIIYLFSQMFCFVNAGEVACDDTFGFGHILDSVCRSLGITCVQNNLMSQGDKGLCGQLTKTIR